MYKAFANGELLTAQKVNDYLMRQSVIVVEDDSDRDDIPTPPDGMVVYREDTDFLEIRTAGAWRVLGPDASASLGRTTDFTMSASFQAVPFQTAPVLAGFTWSSSSNPSRLYAKAAARLIATGQLQLNSTASADLYFRKNGSGTLTPQRTQANSAGAANFALLETFDVAAGDYVELMVKSNSTWPYVASNVLKIDVLTWH